MAIPEMVIRVEGRLPWLLVSQKKEKKSFPTKDVGCIKLLRLVHALPQSTTDDLEIRMVLMKTYLSSL